MPRKFYKHKLLLDEGFLHRDKLPILNHRFNLRHITDDLGYSALSDEQVYQLAIKQKRLVVTFNDRHFQPLALKSTNSGIIGVSSNLTTSDIDKKLTALLMKATKKALFGKFTYISGETEA